MKEVKYIPGDLVMTDGCPIGTKKGVAYIVVASDPSRIITLDNGKIIKCAITLDAVTEEEKYYFVKTSTWIKYIVPIPLNPAILEANGWLKIVDKHSIGYQHPKYLRLQVQVIDSSDKYAAYLNDEFLTKLSYVHQLQHLLFGLGLPMNLKV